jgi:hypothetical protein
VDLEEVDSEEILIIIIQIRDYFAQHLELAHHGDRKEHH